MVKNDINNTDILVQKDDQESYNMFVKKIKNGSLKIKCWKEKNDHSKTFVFKYSEKYSQNNLTPGIVLAGSSNLTRSGFLDNIEGNYLFREPSDYQAHLKQFLDRWNSSNCIDIANLENYDEFENKVIKIIKKYKKVNFLINDDLYEKGIIDSLDLMNIMSDIENKFKIRLNLAKEKKFLFTVRNLARKLKAKN